MLGRLNHLPRMPTIHTSSVALGSAVGIVVNALTECPLPLCLRYGAEVFALSEDGSLKLVSRFHSYISNREGWGTCSLSVLALDFVCFGSCNLRSSWA